MPTPNLIITRGAAGSGKSTWARAWQNEAPMERVVLERDGLRQAMYERDFPVHAEADVAFQREVAITGAHRAAVGALLMRGYDVCVSDTHIEPKYVDAWRWVAQGAGAEFEIRSFAEVALNTCLSQNKLRDRKVPEDVIAKQHARLLAQEKSRV